MAKVVAVALGRFGEVPTIERRVDMHLEDGTSSLKVCPNAWALRRRLENTRTGERKRFRCDRWTCEFCGPRKQITWQRLIEQANPTHHLVLTKAGQTVEQAARALTTFMQALRRGSRGRGRSHVGARQAYPVEYIAVLEDHTDFEENGLHWHCLLISRDEDGEIQDIPYEEVIRPLWTSAVFGKDRQHLRKTMVDKKTGEEYKEQRLGWIKRVKDVKQITYLVKYVTKGVTRERRGKKLVARTVTGLRVVDGKLVEDTQEIMEERESFARRLRYSRHFFPATTRELRRRLFAESSEEDEQQQEETDEQAEGVSEWRVIEIAPAAKSVKAYALLLKEALREEISEGVATGKRLSHQIFVLWSMQRDRNTPADNEEWEDMRRKGKGWRIFRPTPQARSA